MFFRRQYKYIFVLIPLIILYRPFLFFGNYQLNQTVGDIFLSNLFGGSYQREKIEIVLSVTSLFGVFILNILFGDYICKDFFVNSEYIFTREHNKGKWFFRKAIGLAGYCCLGILLYVGVYAIGSILKSNKRMEIEDITVMVFTTILLFEFAYITTLLINVLALKFGTSIAFFVTYSFCIFSEMMTLFLQQMKESLVVKILHYINPLSNVTISWNYSDWFVYWSILYFFLLNGIVLFVGKSVAMNYEARLTKDNS